VALQVPEQDIPPVHGMERLKHLGVPAGDCCVGRTDGIEQVRNYGRFYAGHVAGRDEEEVTPGRRCTGMQSSDRADALPDIRNAPDIPDSIKTPALFRVIRNDDDLVGDVPERVHEPFDESLSLVQEKKFLLPVCPACLPADKDNGGSYNCPLLIVTHNRSRPAAPVAWKKTR